MINQETLLQNYDDKKSNYFLLDVRSPFEFEESHLPGAINIPIEELENNFSELPKTKHIITYCMHGVRSGLAEDFLREKGFRADVLENGLSFWKGQISSGKGD
ncbi:rhodanese-like domain-containing protein [Candidatus Peregrinibacteria bacterium]|nr:rhodanese-like domain-containing protein [Candidatus Peregrinibacteria bacterium]